MKKIALMATMLTIAILCAACSTKTESTSAAPTETTTAETNAIAAKETTTTETTTVPIETGKQLNADTLEEFLSAYPDSTTYHLFFDIMRNDESKSNQDNGVTYMFSKDNNGNRTNEGITAYYSEISDLPNEKVENFCSDFIKMYFPELSEPFKNAETVTDPKYMQAAIFKDYTIVLMPDNDNKGMTVMISKSK